MHWKRLVAVVAAIFLNRTIYGRYLLALGRNEEAARYSGIPTRRLDSGFYLRSVAIDEI